MVFVAFPRAAADVQIRVRGSRKHHPSTFVANGGRKAIRRSVKRPCDHPVRSDGNSGTGFIRRIGVASLSGAAQHVNHSGRCVGRFRLSLHGIHHPSHAHWVHTHGRVADFVFVSRCTHPLIRSLDQNGNGSVGIQSATVASLVTCSGPERRALLILGSSALSVMPWRPGVESLDSVSLRPVSSTMESPDRAAAIWREPSVSEAAAAIVVAINFLRFFIDAHFSHQTGRSLFLNEDD